MRLVWRRTLSGRGKITIFVIGSREDRHDNNDSRLYTDAGRERAPLAAGGVCLHPDGHSGGGGADQLVDWKGRNLIHFAAASKHIGLYPGPDAIVAFAERLKGYKTSKGTVQIPVDRPLPLGLIADLARWSYEHNRK